MQPSHLPKANRQDLTLWFSQLSHLLAFSRRVASILRDHVRVHALLERASSCSSSTKLLAICAMGGTEDKYNMSGNEMGRITTINHKPWL